MWKKTALFDPTHRGDMYKKRINSMLAAMLAVAIAANAGAIEPYDHLTWDARKSPYIFEPDAAQSNEKDIRQAMMDYLSQTQLGHVNWQNSLVINSTMLKDLANQYGVKVPPRFPFDPTSTNWSELSCYYLLGKPCGFIEGGLAAELAAVATDGFEITKIGDISKFGPLDKVTVNVSFNVAARTQGLGIAQWELIPDRQSETITYELLRLTDYGVGDKLIKSQWFILNYQPMHIAVSALKDYFEMETCRLKDMEKGTWEESEIYERLKNNLETLKKIERDTQTDKSAGH